MNREEIINNVKNIILQKVQVEAIVLFGSYARGDERQDSDIDIAIKPKKFMDKNEMIELQNAIEDEINLDVHLINLYTIEEDFKYDILITGKLLYVEDNLRFWNYMFKTFSDYLELNEDRKTIIDALREGGTLYGK